MGEAFPGSVIKGLTALAIYSAEPWEEESCSTYFAPSVSPGLCQRQFTSTRCGPQRCSPHNTEIEMEGQDLPWGSWSWPLYCFRPRTPSPNTETTMWSCQ